MQKTFKLFIGLIVAIQMVFSPYGMIQPDVAYATEPTNTFSLTVTSGDVAASQSNFPAYVDLSEFPETFWTSTNCTDIRVFANADLSTEIAREIVSCTDNGTTGSGEMHVKIPSLASSSVIYVTTDGSQSDYAVGATYGRNAVWSDYLMVQHNPSNTVDSTGNSNVTSTDGTSSTGKVGGAGNFGGPDSGDNDNFNGDLAEDFALFTSQFWGKTTNDSDEMRMFRVADSGNMTGSVQFNRSGTDGKIRLFWRDEYNDAFDSNVDPASVDYSNGNWHMFHSGINGNTNTWTLSINGQAESVTNTTTNTPYRWLAADTFRMGDPGEEWDGDLDEIRLRTGILSATWRETEYNNQSDVAGFWTIADTGSVTLFTPSIIWW